MNPPPDDPAWPPDGPPLRWPEPDGWLRLAAWWVAVSPVVVFAVPITTTTGIGLLIGAPMLVTTALYGDPQEIGQVVAMAGILSVTYGGGMGLAGLLPCVLANGVLAGTLLLLARPDPELVVPERGFRRGVLWVGLGVSGAGLLAYLGLATFFVMTNA